VAFEWLSLAGARIEFTLEARLPDGRVVRHNVVLADGVTTDVTFEFADRCARRQVSPFPSVR